MSNKEGNKWSDNISDVRTMIRKMANSISDEMTKNIESRLAVFTSKYLYMLAAESEQLERVKIGNTEKWMKKS